MISEATAPPPTARRYGVGALTQIATSGELAAVACTPQETWRSAIKVAAFRSGPQ